jgi:hypothetical protein
METATTERTDGLTGLRAGDAKVMTQPISIATSKPNRSTKKSRVAAGRSERMLGTALLIVTANLYG